MIVLLPTFNHFIEYTGEKQWFVGTDQRDFRETDKTLLLAGEGSKN